MSSNSLLDSSAMSKIVLLVAGLVLAAGGFGVGHYVASSSQAPNWPTPYDEIVAETAEHDTDLVLMTYASRQSNYGRANPVIRRVAGETGSRLVQLTAEFERLCPDPTCTEYFQESQHPTAAAYSVVAARVMNAVPDLRAE